MRTITMQADPAVAPVVEDWLARLMAAMPVLKNQGIIFDKDDRKRTATHVNRRGVDRWTVSFRDGGSGVSDRRIYTTASDAAQAIVRKAH